MIAQIVTEFEQKKGVSLDRVNLVGFSLGPHVVGAAGQALKGRARQIVGNAFRKRWRSNVNFTRLLF